VAHLPGSWTLSHRALLVSGALTAILLILIVGAHGIGGTAAAVGAGLGALVCARPALTLRPGQALALTVPAAMVGTVAVGLRGQPLAAASFVALCALLVAPASVVADSILASVPSVAVVLVAAPGDYRPVPIAAWMLVGGIVTVALGALAGRPGQEPRRIPAALAWRHAVVMAAATWPVVLLVTTIGRGHGYWIALTLTVVLRPFDDDTMRTSTQRIAGTIGGALLALVLTGLLPMWALVVFLAGCLILTVGYMLVGEYAQYVVFMTASIVLVGSAGDPGGLAARRVLDTVLGALLAAGTAMLVARWDRWGAHRPGGTG
jgi:hypothetical protein